jgi:hypothetical protein
MDRTNRHSTPTKTKTVLQHLNVLPNTYYEGMELEEICLPSKYQPSSGHCLHRAFYSPKVGSGQIMDRTNRHSTPTKTKTVIQHLYVLPNSYYEGMELEEICLPARYQPSSGHYIEHSIVQKLVLVK